MTYQINSVGWEFSVLQKSSRVSSPVVFRGYTITLYRVLRIDQIDCENNRGDRVRT